MPKLIYSYLASLDGYITDDAGRFDWAEPDEEVLEFINETERSVGTYLYGRKIYQMMIGWETDPSVAAQSPKSAEFARIWQGRQGRLLEHAAGGLYRANPDRAQLRSRDGRNVVLGMVTADFVASNYAYCRKGSALRLTSTTRSGCACVGDWPQLQVTKPAVARLQVLPEGAVAISSWKNRDDAFVSVVLGVERVAREILSSGDSLVDAWLTSRLFRRRV